MFAIDEAFIRKVAPRFSGAKAQAQDNILARIGPVFAATLDGYAINTYLRIAHFMAQVTHECAGFRTTEEFASGAAYEGREDLGNVKRGDGPLFKGRGLIQLTGRANYRRLGKRLDLDLERHPEQAAEPVLSLKIACEYWSVRKLNDPADDDDIITVTGRVNGGQNGLEDRKAYLKKAKAALAELAGTAIQAAQGPSVVVLSRGVTGPDVARLQSLLRAKGYRLAIDNDFGAATELAVASFQKSQNLVADGVAGEKTWMALQA